jgi:hypothetical protein
LNEFAPPLQLNFSVADCRMKYLLALVVSSLLALAVLADSGSASRKSQKFSSGIAGRTTDPNGSVIVGVRIKIVGRSTKTIVSQKSNDVGEYVADLEPDVYDVEADGDGFKKATRKGIPVLREARSFVDFVLEPKPPFDSDHP